MFFVTAGSPGGLVITSSNPAVVRFFRVYFQENEQKKKGLVIHYVAAEGERAPTVGRHNSTTSRRGKKGLNPFRDKNAKDTNRSGEGAEEPAL